MNQNKLLLGLLLGLIGLMGIFNIRYLFTVCLGTGIIWFVLGLTEPDDSLLKLTLKVLENEEKNVEKM